MASTNWAMSRGSNGLSVVPWMIIASRPGWPLRPLTAGTRKLSCWTVSALSNSPAVPVAVTSSPSRYAFVWILKWPR